MLYGFCMANFKELFILYTKPLKILFPCVIGILKDRKLLLLKHQIKRLLRNPTMKNKCIQIGSPVSKYMWTVFFSIDLHHMYNCNYEHQYSIWLFGVFVLLRVWVCNHIFKKFPLFLWFFFHSQLIFFSYAVHIF